MATCVRMIPVILQVAVFLLTTPIPVMTGMPVPRQTPVLPAHVWGAPRRPVMTATCVQMTPATLQVAVFLPITRYLVMIPCFARLVISAAVEHVEGHPGTAAE